MNNGSGGTNIRGSAREIVLVNRTRNGATDRNDPQGRLNSHPPSISFFIASCAIRLQSARH
jgi:hypothetical protein